MISLRDFTTSVHGIVLGGLLVLLYSGGISLLYGLDIQYLRGWGVARSLGLLRVWAVLQAGLSWSTSVVGAFVIYPWYKTNLAKTPHLDSYHQTILYATNPIASLPTFGIQWKAHLGWFPPILTTCVCFLVLRFGPLIAHRSDLRKCCVVLSTLAFASAIVAGLLGTQIARVVPWR